MHAALVHVLASLANSKVNTAEYLTLVFRLFRNGRWNRSVACCEDEGQQERPPKRDVAHSDVLPFVVNSYIIGNAARAVHPLSALKFIMFLSFHRPRR